MPEGSRRLLHLLLGLRHGLLQRVGAPGEKDVSGIGAEGGGSARPINSDTIARLESLAEESIADYGSVEAAVGSLLRELGVSATFGTSQATRTAAQINLAARREEEEAAADGLRGHGESRHEVLTEYARGGLGRVMVAARDTATTQEESVHK